MRYEYEGPGPQVDPEGALVRPGDVREFAEEPPWGPWRLLDEPAPAPEPVSPPAAVSGPSVTTSEPAPKGM